MSLGALSGCSSGCRRKRKSCKSDLIANDFTAFWCSWRGSARGLIAAGWRCGQAAETPETSPAAPAAGPAPRPVTVADLMGLRSISDVRISPDGSQVAYVVSRPSLEKDEH